MENIENPKSLVKKDPKKCTEKKLGNNMMENDSLGAVKKKKAQSSTKAEVDELPENSSNVKASKPKASRKKSSKKKVVDRFMEYAPEPRSDWKNSPRPLSSDANDLLSDLSARMNSTDNLRGSKQNRRASVPNSSFDGTSGSQRPPSIFAKGGKTPNNNKSRTPDPKTLNRQMSTPNSAKRSQVKFEPYIPLFAVQQGLKRGEFIEGALRINPRNYEDAYVNSPDGKMDIYISGTQNRNRALNGDSVVVQINPKQEWKVLFEAIKDHQEKTGESVAGGTFTRNVRSPPCKVHTPSDKFSSPRSRPVSSNSWGSSGCGERLPDTLEILGIDKLSQQFKDLSTTPKSSKNEKRKLRFGQSKGSSVSFSQESAEDNIETKNSNFNQEIVGQSVLGLDAQSKTQNCAGVNGTSLLHSQKGHTSNGSIPSCDLNNIGTYNQKTKPDAVANSAWESEESSVNLIISPEELLSIDGTPIVGMTVLNDSETEQDGIVVPPEDLSGDEFTDSASISSTETEKMLENLDFLVSQQDAQNNNVEIDDQCNHLVVNQVSINAIGMLTSRSEKFIELECRVQEGSIIQPLLCQDINEMSESVICSTVPDVKLCKSHSSSDENVTVESISGGVLPDNLSHPGEPEPPKNDKRPRQRRRRKKKTNQMETNTEPQQDAVSKRVKGIVDILNLTVEEVMQHPRWNDFIQRTGKVIHILERKHSCIAAGQLKLCPDRNRKWALFSPNDSRVPRIMVPMSDCPQNFYSRPDDYATFLFLAQIVEWPETAKFPSGRVIKSLGTSGDVEAQSEAILVTNAVDFSDFSKEVLDCLPPGDQWCISEDELSKRRDFRQECVFTIDPATARDMDDAMSCKILDNGNYEVGVHIADVSYFVEAGTRLDEAANSRSTSVYLVHQVVPMLPRRLCDDLCSLCPNVDRLAFSVLWEMTPQAEVVNQWFGRSIIHSCGKLSYEHAQSMIENDVLDFDVSEFPPISNTFSVYDVANRVNTLHILAQQLREKRFENGALKLDQVKLQFTLSPETFLPSGISGFEQRDSNRLIEEFMLLANMSVARRIYQHFPDLALLRRHPPPQPKAMQQVVSLCEGLGIILDASSSGTLAQSISQYSGEDVFSRSRTELLVNLLSKPMNRALYFCAGVLEDKDLFGHYALAVPFYTHFTSPIRRYPDLIVHRLLGACLGYADPPASTPRELDVIAAHCNDKKYNAKLASEQSAEVFLAAFVRELGFMPAHGMVMGVLDHAFDCLILGMGLVKRVYCDRLPLTRKEFQKSHAVSRLSLFWKEDANSKAVKQILVAFATVDLLLTVDKDSLVLKVMLQKPQNRPSEE